MSQHALKDSRTRSAARDSAAHNRWGRRRHPTGDVAIFEVGDERQCGAGVLRGVTDKEIVFHGQIAARRATPLPCRRDPRRRATHADITIPASLPQLALGLVPVSADLHFLLDLRALSPQAFGHPRRNRRHAAQQFADPRRRDAGPPLHQPRDASARPGRWCSSAARASTSTTPTASPIIEGMAGPVVHGARLRQRGAGRGGSDADAQAFLRAPVHRQEPRSGDRARREAERDRAGADLESVLLQFGIGGERHPDQARLVHEQCARPAATRKRSSAA